MLRNPGDSCSLGWRIKTSFKLSTIVAFLGVLLLVAETAQYSIQHGISPRRAYRRLWAARREESEPTASVNRNHSLRFKAFAVTSGALPQIIETTHWPGVAYSQDRIAIWIIFVFVVATMKSWRLDIEGTRNNFTNFANKDRWEDVMLDVILIQIFLASSASILLLFTYVTGYGDLMYVIFLALSLFHYSMQAEFANHYQVPERKFGMLHLIWALSLFVAYLVATGADTFFKTRGTESFTMRNWLGGVMHGFNLQLMILPATFMVFSLRYRSQCFARLKTSKGVQGHFSEYVAGHLFCASLLHSFLSTSHTCGSGERLKTPWTTYVC